MVTAKSLKIKGTMCEVAERGEYKLAAAVVKDAAYICKRCCRVAPKKKNVCKPKKI